MYITGKKKGLTPFKKLEKEQQCKPQNTREKGNNEEQKAMKVESKHATEKMDNTRVDFLKRLIQVTNL